MRDLTGRSFPVAYTLVDIADLQMCHFRPKCPGAIEPEGSDKRGVRRHRSGAPPIPG